MWTWRDYPGLSWWVQCNHMLSFFLFLKSLLNLLPYCFHFFLLWFFGPKACGVLAPWPGIEPAHPKLEGEILTTGPPGKSSHVSLREGGRGRLGYRRGEGYVVMKGETAMMRPWAKERQGILTVPAAGRRRELILPWSLQKESAVNTLILVLEDSFQTVCLQNYAAKSRQLCPTLCDPIDGSPPGSPIPGILQARTLERVAISFSNEWKWKVKVKSLSRVWLLATPWTAAHQAPPSMGFSRQEYWSGVPLPSPSRTIREYISVVLSHYFFYSNEKWLHCSFCLNCSSPRWLNGCLPYFL